MVYVAEAVGQPHNRHTRWEEQEVRMSAHSSTHFTRLAVKRLVSCPYRCMIHYRPSITLRAN